MASGIPRAAERRAARSVAGPRPVARSAAPGPRQPLVDVGHDLAARIADELFPWLDAPVRRVASLDTWVAYAPKLERAILPEAEDVVAAVEELVAF